MSEAMYKIVPYEVYNAYTVETYEEGNEYKNYTCISYHRHPNARLSTDGSEYVVSCNCGDGTHTLTEIKAYMAANPTKWAEPEGEV